MPRKPKTNKCRYCRTDMVIIAHHCDDICDTCYYTRQSMQITNSYPFRRGDPGELIGLGKENRNQQLIKQICDALRDQICLSCGDKYDIQGSAWWFGDVMLIRLVCQCHESHGGFALFDARTVSLSAVYSELDREDIRRRGLRP